MDLPDYPLFPLSSVVFPGGVMPLRIFEPRYVDLVRICMRGNTGFGVCPLEGGSETAHTAAPRTVGTLVEIVDFDQLDDGMLGITVEGRRRFELQDRRQADNGLWWGTVRFLTEDRDVPCPEEFAPLKQVAAALYARIGEPYASRGQDFESAGWLSARLTELLPFDPATKHDLLATRDPVERLRRIQPLVRIEAVQGEEN
ncbi:peptidase S16, lon domain-containing protein [Salinisphaera sp. PC39]|uniref:LON peptidase substrate-binding domain-containing protein n=1 Tax=Salinisphaera sp. PC39 TaxID=1304156 RepID=UPI0033415606